MCRGFGWLGARDAGRACGGRRGGDPGAAQPLHVQRIPPCISSLFSNKKLARRRNDSNSDSVHECADSVIGPRPVWRRFRWKCGNRATLRTSLRLSHQSPNRVGGWVGMILNLTIHLLCAGGARGCFDGGCSFKFGRQPVCRGLSG